MFDVVDTDNEVYGPDIGDIDFLYGDAAETSFDEVRKVGAEGEGRIGIDYDREFAIYHDGNGDTVVGSPSRVMNEAKKREELNGSELEPGNEGFFDRVVSEVQPDDGEIRRQRNRYQ